jgi:hypothetical protein
VGGHSFPHSAPSNILASPDQSWRDASSESWGHSSYQWL